MSLRDSFAADFPGVPLLVADDVEGVEETLRGFSWIAPDETIEAAGKAGEGNMNLTLRVSTNRRSFIVKQARPWVEKYDFIAAPFDRALVEARFFRRVEQIPRVAAMMPRLLAANDAARALMLEDLGAGSDLTNLYGGGVLREAEALALGRYLAELHGATRGAAHRFDNLEMRSLNAEHIFDIPLLEGNGVDVDSVEPGLGEVAAVMRGDGVLLGRFAELKEIYLDTAPNEANAALLHGDYFPGSWFRTEGGRVCVLDPEFCFTGRPEFDLGVAVAHLALAEQPRRVVEALVGAASGDGVSYDLVAGFAGAEVIRRLLGVAQLPLPPSERRLAKLLGAARASVVDQDLEGLFDVAER